MRLKDKLGNRSNASAEVEYENAVAFLVGEEGRGVRTIIEMVNMTRLDCVIGSAAGMRLGLTQAVHHARHRSAFGRPLIDQPLMRNVLADLALESEAATVLMMRLAGATDRALAGRSQEGLFRRIALAAGKYWVCKRAAGHAAEALECLGGNGYVEESGMPRLFRESPLNGIWEGSGNVAALDLMRALTRDPEAGEAFFAEVELAADPRVLGGRQPGAQDARPRHRGRRPAAGRGDGAGPPGVAADRGSPRRASPTRSAPRGWAARAGPTALWDRARPRRELGPGPRPGRHPRQDAILDIHQQARIWAFN